MQHTPAKLGPTATVAGMSTTNVYLAERTLSLLPDERAALGRLLLESVFPDARSDENIRADWPA